MKAVLKHQLEKMASRYETAEFLKDDPAQFMHQYHLDVDIEIIAFIAASLALGQRPQILAKVETICLMMGESPSAWLIEEKYKNDFPCTDHKFYRFFSYRQMQNLFTALRNLLMTEGSIGRYVQRKCGEGIEPLNVIVDYFKDKCVGQLVPKDCSSCCKRVNMFLRWMVRTNSSVDMGIWSWYDKSRLIIPADTHVMQEAIKLGIIDKSRGTMAKALEITDAMRCIWNDDPCRGDFALFGIGINK